MNTENRFSDKPCAFTGIGHDNWHEFGLRNRDFQLRCARIPGAMCVQGPAEERKDMAEGVIGTTPVTASHKH
jgi:hypothetical protein